MERRGFESLYVHVPFCGKKCAYCAFFSLPDASDDLVDAYLAELARRLDAALGKVAPESVYIGGGTPTILDEARLARLFGMIGRFVDSSGAKPVEVSVECNPETLTTGKAAIIADFANRVPLGAQSFNNRSLRVLGRRGVPKDFHTAVELLKNAEIADIGCDLIHSIPDQSLEEWEADLREAAASGVSHISTYSLTFEEGTALAASGLIPPDTDLDAAMWELSSNVLGESGFLRYEVSNFAKPGFECRHNMDVWHGGTLLGLGPSAASFDGVDRWTEPADIAEWLDGAPPEIDAISAERRADEIFALGLRTAAGWGDGLLVSRTGFGFERWEAVLNELTEAGLLKFDGRNASPTERGMELWDDIAKLVLAE